MAVASAADVLAVLTPQGRALRKIVEPDAAAEQMAHWRRAGLRIGLRTAAIAALPLPGLEAVKRGCDRLVLCVEAGDSVDAAPVLAETAALGGIDLICPVAEGSLADILALLRPDVLLDPEVDEDLAALVQSWGGSASAAAAVGD